MFSCRSFGAVWPIIAPLIVSFGFLLLLFDNILVYNWFSEFGFVVISCESDILGRYDGLSV